MCYKNLQFFSHLQRDIDLLNVNENSLETVSLFKLSQEDIDILWSRYAVKDYETMELLKRRGRKEKNIWLLTFDDFFEKTDFTALMQRLLKTIEKAYEYPVDVEFTVNFAADKNAKINIVQCRPLFPRLTISLPWLRLLLRQVI
jgi:hypothetical protein